MAATGTLTIVTPSEVETMEWNGIPKERAEARARFEEVMRSKTYFAFVETSPGKAEQVRTFDEVEKYEHELGKANVTVQPSLVGG